MTYTQIYDLKNPPIVGQSPYPPATALKKKATVAVATAAQSILIESESVPNHTARAAWAKNALVNAETTAEQMMWAVLANGDVQTGGEDTPDATVQYVVDVSVNLFAR